jgi:hypothetical protein
MMFVSMIKVTAEMKNLRRGHDAQGRLKKIRLDSSSEGYSNYMAPMRMKEIEHKVQIKKAEAKEKGEATRLEELQRIFTTDVLKPETDTFISSEWDEFVPFPTSKLDLNPCVQCYFSNFRYLNSLESPFRRVWQVRLYWS